MKNQIEKLKDTIAKEYGFNGWDQYFEYFMTTKPGREILRNGIRKVLWEVFLLSDDLLSGPKCILKDYDSKNVASKVSEKRYYLRQELQKINKKTKRTPILPFIALTMDRCLHCPSISKNTNKIRKQRNRVQNQVAFLNS